MNDIVLSQLDIDEVLRYLGCPPQQADAATKRLAEDCAQEMLQLIRPRWTYRTDSVSQDANGVRLGCGLLLPGTDIRRHLQGCEQITLFAVTLSAAVDLAVRRAESRDLARALCLDCCATTAVEQACPRLIPLSLKKKPSSLNWRLTKNPLSTNTSQAKRRCPRHDSYRKTL